MAALSHVPVGALHLERFESVLPPEDYERILRTVRRGREVLDGRVVWNVNSTARGGGVAEMLQTLLAYARGAGVDARWMVIDGDPEFFRSPSGSTTACTAPPGDGGPLGAARAGGLRARCSTRNADELAASSSRPATS